MQRSGHQGDTPVSTIKKGALKQLIVIPARIAELTVKEEENRDERERQEEKGEVCHLPVHSTPSQRGFSSLLLFWDRAYTAYGVNKRQYAVYSPSPVCSTSVTRLPDTIWTPSLGDWRHRHRSPATGGVWVPAIVIEMISMSRNAS